ncbi:MAG: STAS domain-containing protein [Planctomycetota bacterium]|jgi:anti-anti-sigma factor
MKINKQDYGEVTVVELQGDLDVDSIEQLQNTINEMVGPNRKGIVLDVSTVGFIDSKGLELLLWARDYSDQNNCQFRLAGLDENCSKILEITRLEKEFDCYAELTEAVKSFA